MAQQVIPNVSAAPSERRAFVGGSDVRIIMGDDEAALRRLWQEKRGEVEPRTCRAISSFNLGGDRGPQPPLVRGQ